MYLPCLPAHFSLLRYLLHCLLTYHLLQRLPQLMLLPALPHLPSAPHFPVLPYLLQILLLPGPYQFLPLLHRKTTYLLLFLSAPP
ncbi:hypothetical protein D5281_13925 [bacterium 1xD42-62]|uniref:Uncharacterized protein n=1 Tax=Parablautia muri TaxID=2320879 RepID=A0A9X5BGH8_9FIRM|nr:hypothetical protein [Parablautia muri]